MPRRGEQGFTLVELLVVTVILGILTGVSVPRLLGLRERAWQAELTATMRAVGIDVESDAVRNGGSYVGLAAGFTGAPGGYLFDVQDAAADPVVVVANPADFTATSFVICGRHLAIDGDGDGTVGEDDHHVAFSSDSGGIVGFQQNPTSTACTP